MIGPGADAFVTAARIEAVLIYWSLLIVSLYMTRRYNGLAKAIVLWMLGEAIFSSAILYYGPSTSGSDTFRVVRVATGAILLFELAQIVSSRMIQPAIVWLWIRVRQGWRYMRGLR